MHSTVRPSKPFFHRLRRPFAIVRTVLSAALGICYLVVVPADAQEDLSAARRRQMVDVVRERGVSDVRVLDAMGRVVPEQRWGLGALPAVRFKGGWGPSEAPGGGYEVIQVGIVAGRVIALAASAPDFEAAKELASKHVPQHQNAPQLRATGD